MRSRQAVLRKNALEVIPTATANHFSLQLSNNVPKVKHFYLFYIKVAAFNFFCAIMITILIIVKMWSVKLIQREFDA